MLNTYLYSNGSIECEVSCIAGQKKTVIDVGYLNIGKSPNISGNFSKIWIKIIKKFRKEYKWSDEILSDFLLF